MKLKFTPQFLKQLDGLKKSEKKTAERVIILLEAVYKYSLLILVLFLGICECRGQDLRHNPGGNFQKSRPIVEGIRKRRSINQKGHLFVITGRNTGSAATKTAAQLKTSTEAIIVGEDSRSNPNFSYNSEHFRLPNSRLEVGYTEELRRLFPELGDTVPIDVAVENTFEDYRSDRDRVLETVLTYEKE